MNSEQKNAGKKNPQPKRNTNKNRNANSNKDKPKKNPWQKLTKKKRKEIIQTLRKYAFITLMVIIPFSLAFSLYMWLPDFMAKRHKQPVTHYSENAGNNKTEPQRPKPVKANMPRTAKSAGTIETTRAIPQELVLEPKALEIKPEALMVSPEDTSENRKLPIADSLDMPLIAIIIDDFGPGLSRKVIQGFIDMPFDLTLAIMPGNDFTVRTSEQAWQAGKETMLHLPMEPIDSVAMDERDMVYCRMDSSEVAEIFNRATQELPYSVGLNNHMGSRATSDSALMDLIASEVFRRGMYFIDSRTAPQSCGLKTMRQHSVPSAGRDVFLDFTDDPAIIRQQVEKSARIASKRGWAIAIGHARRETLNVLNDALPKLQEDGYRFVFVSALLETIDSNFERTQKYRTL